MKEKMVIFTRTFDFISWLMPLTMNFPRSQRFVITKRLQDAVLDFYEVIIEANVYRNKIRLSLLMKADVKLTQIRHYLRLCEKLGWISQGQYLHAANFVAEIGRLLGGWLKISKG